MRTPEEIKMGLKSCSDMTQGQDCRGCEYRKSKAMCIEELMADALTYINYLEEHADAFNEWRAGLENYDLISRSELLKKAGWYNLYGENENRSIHAVSSKEIAEMPSAWMSLPEMPEEGW